MGGEGKTQCFILFFSSPIFSSLSLCILAGRVRGGSVVQVRVRTEWSHSVVKSVRSCELVKVRRACQGLEQTNTEGEKTATENILFLAGCGRRDVPHTVPTPQSRLSQGISVLNHRK